MSVALVLAAVKTLIEAAGAKNVTAWDAMTLDADEARQDRIHDGRVHFWVLRVPTISEVPGIGYREISYSVEIEGRIGLARDEPNDGTKTDVTAAALLRAVIAALSAPSARAPGGSLDSRGVVGQLLPPVPVQVGTERVPCHRLRVTYTVTEDA